MRRYATVFAVVIGAGCTSHDERVQIAAPSSVVQQRAQATSEVPPIGRGIPHAADIAFVAVTDAGDAALTVDTTGSLRLWPTLDGARAPVAVPFASDPEELAIAHAGGLPGSQLEHDLVAIIRDRAGSVSLLRVGLDGTLRDSKQLPETGYLQLAAVDDGFVVRTHDHAIEWYALDGTLRGRVVADAGQQVVALAGRHHHAAALVQTGDATSVRWLQLADTLRWEPAIPLPMAARPGTFAIAPHTRRLAFADSMNRLRMFDASLSAGVLDTGNQAFVSPGLTGVGFVDDDSLALAGATLGWWRRPAPDMARDDAWSPTDVKLPAPLMFPPAGAFADGLVVSATSGQLVLATPSQVRYLGWALPAAGGFQAATGHVTMRTSSSRYAWIDDNLKLTGSLDLSDTSVSYTYGEPIGAHHFVALTNHGDLSDVSIIDATQPERRMVLVPAASVEGLVVRDNMVGVRTQGKLRRFRLDLDAMTSTELLPAIALDDYSIAQVEIFDPERTHGLAAISVGWERETSERQVVKRHRVNDGKLVVEREKYFDGSLVRFDADGSLSLLDPSRHQLRVLRDAQVIKEIGFEVRGPIVASADYSRVVMRDLTGAVVLLDDHGTELWRVPLWQANEVMFSPTESRVFVSSAGGILALDAKTGNLVDRACGFDFGIHDKPGELAISGQGSVCEDSLVQ